MIKHALAAFGVMLLLGGLWAYGVIGLRPTAFAAPLTFASDAPEAGTVRRVLILGTSLTTRGTWVAELEAELQGCQPEVTVDRLARAGASSSWGLPAFREAVATGQPPYDLVIAEFVANDGALWRGMPLFMSRRQHETLIAEIRATGASVTLATMSPAWGWNGWAERPGHRRYFGMYRDLAKAFQTGLIDTLPEWHALPQADREELIPDGLHPAPEAMRRITIPAFLEFLTPLVCD